MARGRILAVVRSGLQVHRALRTPSGMCASSSLVSSNKLFSPSDSNCSSAVMSRSDPQRLHLHPLHTSSCLPSSRRGHWVSVEDARKFLARLPVPQRECLEEAVMEARREAEAEEGGVTPPTWRQLKLLGYHHALPFIGFGFLDNFIMITVGEYIDINVGVALSISTMAAAGIGNLISDLAGLGLADRVEALCKLLGLPDPKLTQAQLHHRSSRWTGLLGRCLGITVGCIIGMAPLLLIEGPHKADPCEGD